MSELTERFDFAKPTNLINSATANAQAQQVSAAKTAAKPLNLIQNAINNPPPPKTQYQLNQEDIDKLSPYNPVKYYSTAMNWLTQGNPVGQFVSRVGSAPDAIMSGGNPASVRPDLGQTANKVADILGAGLTLAVPSGAPLGAGPIAAPYNAVDNLVAASPRLQRAESTVTNTLTAGGRIRPQTAQAVTREAFREGTAGALQGPAIAAMQGQPTNRELAENAGLGVLAGAGLSALPLAAQPIRSAINNRRVGNALMQGIENTVLPVNIPRGISAGIKSDRMAELRSIQETPKSIPQAMSSQAEMINSKTTKRLTKLEDIVRNKGFKNVDPETIAKSYNNMTWYHGTGSDQLNADSLDPFVGNHESLFGQGIYLTDDPKIAGGYAKSRGRRSKTPTVYESNINIDRVLDLESPITQDVYQAISKSIKPLDYQYNSYMEEQNHFTKLLNQWVKNGDNPEQIITKLRNEISDFSHESEIPTSEFVENFQELAINLKQAGYDGLTHTGGKRTGNLPHRVLIMLDPQGLYSNTSHTNQFTRFEKYVPSVEPQQSGISPVNINPTNIDQDTIKQSWFTNLFGEQGLGISPVSGRGTGRMVSTQDQIVKSAIKNDVQGIKDSAAAQARATYQNFVDYLSPLKKVDNETYQTAMDASRANNLANTIARDAFVTPEGEVVGESLQNIFKKVPRGQDQNFVDYLILRHAKTRMGRGERVYDESLNMTPEKVRERIETLEKRYPGFQQIAQEWDQFNDNVLQYLGVNEGLISDDLYKALRDKNPYYAPMRRQFSRSEKPGRKSLAKTTSSSFSGQKAPIKEVSPTGSTRRIVDPRKTTIETIGSWTNAALRNRTMQSLVNAIKRDPEGMKGIAEIVKGPNDKRNLRDILLDDGIDDFVEALDSDFKAVFKTTKLSNDNVVRAMVDGQPIYLQVNDPEIVKTLIGMGPQASNALIDFFGSLSNAIKRGATGVFAPVFAIKGATMDLVQSAIQAKNPAQQMAYTVYGIISGIADRLNVPGLRNMAQEFRRSGGEFSASLKGDRRVNRQISDMTRYPILSPRGLAQTARKTVESPFKALEAIGDIAENAPRMAAYKIEMNRLGGEKSPENVRSAMEQAREITVNFSRKGSLTRDIEAFVPYNNAAVQGTYRILRAFKENPVRTLSAIAGLSVLPKLYEYTQFADDPDYQQLPARERYRFLIVSKNPDGTFVKIPMEPAYNSFGELTIEALRAFKDQDPTAFKGMADALANAWLPPAATGALQGITQGGGVETSIAGAINSTVAAPFVATAANQSFTGAPIVSQGLSDRSPQYQYDERTSAIAKELGKYLNMSPMKVDYLIRSYGGDPARLLLPLTSDVGAGNIRNTLLKNFIVDPQVTTTLSDDFYTARENMTRAYRDNQEAGAPLPSWYNDELRKQITSTARGSISKQISDYRTKIKEVSADKSLSATEKTRQLRELRQQMNKIYVDINQRLEEAGVPLK